jgi:hypothetical protein
MEEVLLWDLGLELEFPSQWELVEDLGLGWGQV